MLAPDSRALLLDALRPPSGHSLDRAVATTFTLDLETALMVPLAFAGFRFEEQPDPVEVMEALRGMGERFDIFCQAGAIDAGSWPSDLVALLEHVIREVRRPRPGHIFHPKIWVLRFLDRSEEPSYRLLVLSRNLTGDRSWDTILWLDGRPEERPLAINEPLARFVAALPGLSVTRLPPGRRAALAALAEELRRVRWDRPAGVRELRFHPIGLPGSPPFPVDEHFAGEPFLDAEAVHDGEHARLGGEAGADEGGCVVEGCGLEAAEHPVDGADGGGVAGDGRAFECEVAVVRFDAEAALGDGVVVVAEEKAHVVPGLGEARAVVGADCPGADDGYGGHGRRS